MRRKFQGSKLAPKGHLFGWFWRLYPRLGRPGRGFDLHQCAPRRRRLGSDWMMRSERAAHSVEVNRDACGHDDWLGMKIGQGPGGAVDDEHSYQKHNNRYRAGLRSI